MGVSLAVEDAVSLATVLDLATKGGSKGSRNLKHALSLFENVRKRRAESVQEASLHSGNMVHIPWGPDRDALYESLRHAHQDDDSLPIGKDGGKRVIFGIADKRTRDWCYGYDAVADVTSAYYSEG